MVFPEPPRVAVGDHEAKLREFVEPLRHIVRTDSCSHRDLLHAESSESRHSFEHPVDGFSQLIGGARRTSLVRREIGTDRRDMFQHLVNVGDQHDVRLTEEFVHTS